MKKKVAWYFYVLAVVVAGVWALDYALFRLYGLGNPVLYEDNPLYGYRPRPHQDVRRFGGKRVRINNLGLRADADWDTLRANKILVLGNSVTYGGSYVDNAELFATRLAAGRDSLRSASGGVNGWGVGNLHGLVVNHGFRPARTYVTVLLEGDFLRGLTLIGGLPLWVNKPRSALHEVVGHYLGDWVNRTRGQEDHEYERDPRLRAEIVANACRHLKALDDTLRQCGFRHFIVISPTRDQVFHAAPRDSLVHRLARAHGLRLVYLLPLLRPNGLTEGAVFHDAVHLNAPGHAVWAEAMRNLVFEAGP